ncbi:Alpha/Beta hydrolase protein [Suillus paluster]|uniref:Alpha/Beta hydrolase protein n=1 Tax=Suillus paluster TaxID=48578 RepID=UPI001B87B64C|nr:Alpha/Beta hydrolase protein [Suillus paluster]KAG1753773.1 Alpha/Beta hydrolase protein [Suillus paluster]
MHTSMSASQWGSPTASKRALLIHGMTMSSHSWEGLAQILAAEGYFVVAPNLLGHAWRRSTDYRISTLAEDLRPYFVTDTSYDVIIGHSLAGPVTLSLLPFLPKTKETTVILLDPVLEIAEERIEMHTNRFLKEIANVRTADEHMAENHAWSRRDCVLRALGVSMCDRTVVEGIYGHNRPWSFSGLLKNIPPNVKITVLASDPTLNARCYLEHIPRDVERLNARVLTGIGHWIQYEHPDAIMDVVPLPRAKL